jgi:Immunity protein Imm1
MNSWRLLGYHPSDALNVDKTICTREDLQDVLPDAMAKAAASSSILELESPTNKVLSFGVSENKGSVQYTPSRETGPYYWPVGDAALSRGNAVVAFYYLGSESEIPLRNCIGAEQVVSIVHEFFDTDQRPQSVEWEEV